MIYVFHPLIQTLLALIIQSNNISRDTVSRESFIGNRDLTVYDLSVRWRKERN
jgi:hypothetical protein